MSSPSPSEPYHAVPVSARVLPEREPPRRGRFWARLFIVLLMGGLGLSIMLNFSLATLAGLGSLDSDARVQEKYFSHKKVAEHKVAILSIDGVIADAEGFFKQEIERVKNDPAVRAIVLRVNSPGGTVSASDALYHHLKKLREKRNLPIVVSMGTLAASGGYYISMAAGDQPGILYAEPTSWIGSIGVQIPHFNVGDLMKQWGVQEDSVVSHRLKTIGSMTRPMTEEERKIFQSLVDESFAKFKEIIKAGRRQFREKPELLDAVATGQIFSAEQAKSKGLIDEIGFVEEAVAKAIELAHLDPDTVSVVKYKRDSSLAGLILGSTNRNLPDLAALLDTATPRAYYLFSWPLAAKE